MPDQIETATEALPVEGILLGRNSSIVVMSLATYGALSLARDTANFVQGIRYNRKAKKAAEKKAETTPEQ